MRDPKSGRQEAFLKKKFPALCTGVQWGFACTSPPWSTPGSWIVTEGFQRLHAVSWFLWMLPQSKPCSWHLLQRYFVQIPNTNSLADPSFQRRFFLLPILFWPFLTAQHKWTLWKKKWANGLKSLLAAPISTHCVSHTVWLRISRHQRQKSYKKGFAKGWFCKEIFPTDMIAITTPAEMCAAQNFFP